MHMVWSLMFTLWYFLPWVAIGFMAGLTFRKRRESRSLMLQAIGACSMFLLGAAQWVVMEFILKGLAHFAYDSKTISAGNAIFEFLLFLALAIFALGYCAERFKRRNQAIQVTATPAD